MIDLESTRVGSDREDAQVVVVECGVRKIEVLAVVGGEGIGNKAGVKWGADHGGELAISVYLVGGDGAAPATPIHAVRDVENLQAVLCEGGEGKKEEGGETGHSESDDAAGFVVGRDWSPTGLS